MKYKTVVIQTLVLYAVFLMLFTSPVASVVTKISGQFLVQVEDESISLVDNIAAEHGLINAGNVGEIPNLFLFKKPEATIGAKSTQHTDSIVIEKLESHESVMWIEQDAHRVRIAESGGIPTDPSLEEGKGWHLKNNKYPRNDINVLGVWESGNSGQGVVVQVMDEGVFIDNPDIAPNFASEFSWDFAKLTNDPTPPQESLSHGTFVSGLLAGKNDNGFCGAGVAYGAKIAGVRFLGTSAPDSGIAEYLTKYPDQVHISSNSWGYTGCYKSGCFLLGESRAILAAFEHGAKTGRQGKGRIFVFSAGNDGAYGGDVNMFTTKTSRFIMPISALDIDGSLSKYSAIGSPIFVAAPGGGSKSAINSMNAKSCSSGQGTSFACPQVSGVAALMLAQNSSLSWRDVKYILAATAYKNDADDTDWSDNAAGYHVNHKYGFGLVNAAAAVKLAESWVPVGPEESYSILVSANATIPDNDYAGVVSSVEVGSTLLVEHVTVVLNIEHPSRGELAITLISPSGTISKLFRQRIDNGNGYSEWTTITVRHWGENATGVWKLRVQDGVEGNQGILTSWRLDIFGVQENHNVNYMPCSEEFNPRLDFNNSRKDIIIIISSSVSGFVGLLLVVGAVVLCLRWRKMQHWCWSSSAITKSGSEENLVHTV